MVDSNPQNLFHLGIAIVALWTLIALYTFGTFFYRVKREVKDLINKDHDKTGSAILTSEIREWYFDKLQAFEEFFLKIGISPNQLSCLGFTLSCIAAYLFHLGWIGTAGWVVLAGGTFDILDGVIARKSGKCSRGGAYFDSVLDRYADLIVFAGLVSFYRNTPMVWVVFVAIIGANMVSYTRAKAETEGVSAKVGIMQRPERYVFLGFGALFSDFGNVLLAPWYPNNHFILMATIIFIAFMSNLTAARRFRFAYLKLKEIG